MAVVLAGAGGGGGRSLTGDLIVMGAPASWAFYLVFVDRNARRHWRTRPVAMTLAAIVVLAIIVLSILAVTTPAAKHLM